MKQTKDTLKTYFETGDVPTELQFEDLIDSMAHTDDVDAIPKYGLSIQGNTLSLTNDNTQNTVELNTPFTGTYEEISVLVATNELTIGRHYIINNYQTEYFIEGSNSSGIIEEKTISDNISGWGVLDGRNEFDLNHGDTVEIIELPPNYTGTLTVGETTTVSSESSDYYFRFSNGMHSVVGLKFKYAYNRYEGIPIDALINDANEKPVLKSGGIVNTEVHDGMSYMDMTAIENSNVPVETLVLKASTSNTFEEIGFSETYKNDIVYYDFNDTEIKNDNNEVIATRKGFIKRRVNNNLKIDSEIDWRVHKFRRWLLDTTSITSFINENELVTTRAGYDNKYLFSSKNRTTGNKEAFYIAKTPEGIFMNVDKNGLKKEFNYSVESNISAKDFTVFKINADRNPIDVDQFIVKGKITNSVFMGLGGEFNYKLFINIVGEISQSTFVSNIISAKENKFSFVKVTALDSIYLNGSNNTFNNVQILSLLLVYQMEASIIQDSILGTINSNIAGNPVPFPVVSWLSFQSIINSEIGDTAIGVRTSRINIINSKLILSSLFFYYSPTGSSEDAKYTKEVTTINNSIFARVGLRMTSNLDRVNFSNVYFQDSNTSHVDGLFLYDITSPLDIVDIKKNKYNHKLYYTDVDTNDQTQIITLANAI